MIALDDLKSNQFLKRLETEEPSFKRLLETNREIAIFFADLCHDLVNGQSLRDADGPTRTQLLFDAIRDIYRQLGSQKQLVTVAINDTKRHALPLFARVGATPEEAETFAIYDALVRNLTALTDSFRADSDHDIFIDPQTAAIQRIAAALDDISPRTEVITSTLVEAYSTQHLAQEQQTSAQERLASALEATLSRQQRMQEEQTTTLDRVVSALDVITTRISSLPPAPPPRGGSNRTSSGQ